MIKAMNQNLNSKWLGMTLFLMTSLTASCGMDVKVKDSDHTVEVSDSEQTITVRTTLDRVLEVCGIILPDGSVVPYAEWTDAQHECLEKLDQGDLLDGKLSKLERAEEES